jgi:hypothetical protein
MLANLPLDLQTRVMSYLERGDVYQACLASRRLNEAATRILYLEPIWSVGCCEERDNAVRIFSRCMYVIYKLPISRRARWTLPSTGDLI